MFGLDCEKAFRQDGPREEEDGKHVEVEALGGKKAGRRGWTECRWELPHGNVPLY